MQDALPPWAQGARNRTGKGAAEPNAEEDGAEPRASWQDGGHHFSPGSVAPLPPFKNDIIRQTRRSTPALANAAIARLAPAQTLGVRVSYVNKYQEIMHDTCTVRARYVHGACTVRARYVHGQKKTRNSHMRI